MSVVFVDGVAWFDRALASARHKGVADQVTELARLYLDGVKVMKYDDPIGYGRVRVERDGVAAVIGPDSIVIGFVTSAAELRLTARTQPRAGKGKGSMRGPRDYPQLEEWLVEGGFRVQESKGHKAVLDSEGNRVATLPSTPSDRRSLLNSTAELRKVTGLGLRK